MSTYIALVKAEASRIEVCTVDPAGETAHSHWVKRTNGEAYLGLVRAYGPDAALKDMSESSGVPAENIRLVELVVGE